MTDKRFANMIGPWTSQTNIDSSGALYATYAVTGYASQLAQTDQIDAVGAIMNHQAMQLGHHSTEWYWHFTRAELGGMTPLPACNGWFAQRYDEAYRHCLGRDGLYTNALWFTVVKRAPVGMRASLRNLFNIARSLVASSPAERVRIPYAEQVFLDEFEELAERIKGWLNSLGAVRLKLEKREDGGWYNQIDEAYHLIMNNFWRPMPVTRGRCANNILPYPIKFGEGGTLSIHTSPTSERLVTMYGLANLPVNANPKMFDGLHAAPFGCTLTNSILWRRRSVSIKELGNKVKMMTAAGDEGGDDIVGVKDAKKKTEGGHNVWGIAHFSLGVHSRGNLRQHDAKTIKAEGILDNALIGATRESHALKPAYYCQAIGNRYFRTRPNRVPSDVYCAFAAPHSVPTAPYEGRWGAPLVSFRTTEDTEYHYHLQVVDKQASKGDLGSFGAFGPSASGKTSVAGSIVQFAVTRQGAKGVIVDKGRGLGIMVNANGGAYLVLEDGLPTGLAPLRALTNSPAHLSYLKKLIMMLITSDGQGVISSEEDELLGRALEIQMSMPPRKREMAAIAVALSESVPSGLRDSARNRLKKWCWGQDLGWVVDCREDLLDMRNQLTGYDTTSILKHPVAAGPILNYILYRTDEVIDGTPFLLFIDEYWSLDANPTFSADTDEKLATIRKKEGCLGFATQNIRTMLNSRHAHTFRQQVPTKIHTADADASVEDLLEAGWSLPEIHAIKVTLSTRPHQFLVKRPSGSFIAQFDMSRRPGHIAVISGRDATYELMIDLKKKYGEKPELWVPHFERLAPGLVDKPVLRKVELVA